MGLAYPFILLANLLFMGFWIMRRKKEHECLIFYRDSGGERQRRSIFLHKKDRKPWQERVPVVSGLRIFGLAADSK